KPGGVRNPVSGRAVHRPPSHRRASVSAPGKAPPSHTWRGLRLCGRSAACKPLRSQQEVSRNRRRCPPTARPGTCTCAPDRRGSSVAIVTPEAGVPCRDKAPAPPLAVRYKTADGGQREEWFKVRHPCSDRTEAIYASELRNHTMPALGIGP